MNYFFDTYALQEIAQASGSYLPYATNTGVVTTKLNLMELYYGYVSKGEPETAEKLFEKFSQFCVKIGDDTLKEAMWEKVRLRKILKKSNVSYVDCIGYVVARKLKVKFLTGDSEFEGLDNVEFVK
ncbi:PIN domain-containing protein [Candidatus Woesearchaeota archaeon]|nr:PIN domain-containing protein [Candidatus Woesearchaeota archaeon]